MSVSQPSAATATDVLPFGEEAIAAAARVILAGGCVAVPTETVYGLAADATNDDGVARIYAAKGRPGFNPLIVHVTDLAAAECLAEFDDQARSLAHCFWPGPLTLVLPVRHGAVSRAVTAGLPTVAIRVSAHRAIQGLLHASARPLAAPSANASNRISPTRADHVVATLGGRIALIIDDGPTSAGIESTIVEQDRVLRPGPITAEQVAECIATTRDWGRGSPQAVARDVSDLQPIVGAPGQLATHYAPTKPLRLNVTDRRDDEWLIGFGAVSGDETLSVTGNLDEAAARLFDALYRADASARARIAVAPVPSEGVGVAINDRLRRAAHIELPRRDAPT